MRDKKELLETLQKELSSIRKKIEEDSKEEVRLLLKINDLEKELLPDEHKKKEEAVLTLLRYRRGEP